MVQDHVNESVNANVPVHGEGSSAHVLAGMVRSVWAALVATGELLSQVLSALDDRNPQAALCVLEPARAGETARCVRCATRGE